MVNQPNQILFNLKDLVKWVSIVVYLNTCKTWKADYVGKHVKIWKWDDCKMKITATIPNQPARSSRTTTTSLIWKQLIRVIFHSTNERSRWIKDNICNPNLNNGIFLKNANLNNSILLKNANLNNSILLKSVSYCCFYCWNDQWDISFEFSE